MDDVAELQIRRARTQLILAGLLLVICAVVLVVTMPAPGAPQSLAAAERGVTNAWMRLPVWLGLGLSSAWIGTAWRKYAQAKKKDPPASAGA